jgi:aminomethyltransferase
VLKGFESTGWLQILLRRYLKFTYFCGNISNSEQRMGELKNVALNDVHVALGAKMVPFAGYNMPVRYSSDLDEHHTVRQKVGIFDVSHMGEFMVRGPQALELIQRVTTNDAAKLTDGKIQYSCLPNAEGGIVDDLLVYRFNDQEYMLVVNASNIEKDWQWLNQYNINGAQLENISDNIALFAVQGPHAITALQPLTEVNLGSMVYYTFAVAAFAGVPNVIISATGYTGAGGFEIYVPNEHAQTVWEKIMAAGAPFGIKPIGLGARDTLRLEMGYCLYGNDINDSTSPLEGGLGWITKFSKSFVNSENLKAQKEAGVNKKLVAFEMQEAGIPRAHYPITNEAGNLIGEVTSGTQSPTLGKGIGMGYIQTQYSQPDQEIFIKVRNKSLRAKTVKLPFVKPQ